MSSEKKDQTPNRLIEEKSPYLLQHAYNPVDWHAWNEEAFEKAKSEKLLQIPVINVREVSVKVDDTIGKNGIY